MKELAGDEIPVQMDMSSLNILSAGKIELWQDV
jgi:hypothetical protein